MLCAKFGWNWPSGSGEEDENVKSLRQRQRQQRRRTTDKFWSEKLTWAFGSGELKMNLQWFRFDITLCEKLDFSVKDKIITVLKSSNKLALFMDIWKFKNTAWITLLMKLGFTLLDSEPYDRFHFRFLSQFDISTAVRCTNRFLQSHDIKVRFLATKKRSGRLRRRRNLFICSVHLSMRSSVWYRVKKYTLSNLAILFFTIHRIGMCLEKCYNVLLLSYSSWIYWCSKNKMS